MQASGKGSAQEEEIQRILDAHPLEDEGTLWKCVACGRRRLTRATLDRFWRLRRGLTFALSRKKLPGRAWRIIMGHATYVGLLRRDLLASFSAIYSFIEVNLDTSAPLWPSARREMDGVPELADPRLLGVDRVLESTRPVE